MINATRRLRRLRSTRKPDPDTPAGVGIPRQQITEVIRARRIEIVDEHGAERIRLDVLSSGLASITVHHPDGESHIALEAGLDLEMSDETPRAQITLVDHWQAATFDALGACDLEGRLQAIEKRLDERDAEHKVLAYFANAQATTRRPPLVELECQRCGGLIVPERLRAHVRACDGS